jgi:hypothetical protein
MHNAPTTDTLPPLSKDYRAGLDAALAQIVAWAKEPYGWLTYKDVSTWMAVDRFAMSADHVAGLADGLAAYLCVVLTGDAPIFPAWHPLDEIRAGEDRHE